MKPRETEDGAAIDAGRSRAITELLSKDRGKPVTVTSLRRQPSPFATLAPVEVVSVGLVGGEKLSLFVKNLGFDPHPDKLPRDRECRVYEQLLGAGDLPVVRFYGSTLDPASGRHFLYLEFVDGWDLRYRGLEHWATAIGELARLQAWFARRPHLFESCGSLLRFDAAYFQTWAKRAEQATAAVSGELAATLRAALTRYPDVAHLLATQPPTLVHNDLSPKNVVADTSTVPARICFVDWEMAGIGCGPLDLVHLSYGLGPADHRRMEQLYAEAQAGESLLPSAPGLRRRLLAACELHKALYRLAHTRRWKSPRNVVAAWVADVRRLSGQV